MSGVHSLNIGRVELENNLVLAPLAGFTDIAFRRLCKESGVGLTVTEMVSVNGLKYGSEGTEILLRRVRGETPCAVQLFGSDPETFALVLRQRECLDPFDIIDINMGCPMPKVTRQGAGSALLKDKGRASEIVRACVESAHRPVTVKMRLGIDNAFGAEEFALAVESAGAAAVTVHGRTVRQLYSGSADWHAIARVKNALSIPVVGNGDVADKASFEACIEASGVDGVMIGRGALGNPQVFAEILGRKRLDFKTVALRHIDYMREYFSDEYAAKAFRKHAVHYFKGIPRSKDTRLKVLEAKDTDEIKRLIADFAAREE